jgi:hypothetical protein
MGFHKSSLLQHVLTSQILMDRIRVHRFTLQLMECVLQRQDLCGCTVSFVLYAVVPQMDQVCSNTGSDRYFSEWLRPPARSHA